MTVVQTWKLADAIGGKTKMVKMKMSYGAGDTTVTCSTGLRVIDSFSVSPCSVATKYPSTEKPKEEVQKTIAAPAELPLNQKMMEVMKEYVNTMMQQFKADIEKRMVEEKTAIENELITSVRTGLGIQKDPVVHLSEVEGMVRKIVLTNTPEAKKTLTDTTPPPAPDNNQKIDVNAAFTEVIKSKGAL